MYSQNEYQMPRPIQDSIYANVVQQQLTPPSLYQHQNLSPQQLQVFHQQFQAFQQQQQQHHHHHPQTLQSPHPQLKQQQQLQLYQQPHSSPTSSSTTPTSPIPPPHPQPVQSQHAAPIRRASRVGKAKRVRTIFTPEQLRRLEQEFVNQMYLVGGDRGNLAKSLNLTEAQVKVWFQNRRIKFRKFNSGPMSRLPQDNANNDGDDQYARETGSNSS